MELPAIREELTLYPGPENRHGAPTWVLHDPAQNRFFQLPWIAVEILGRWHLKEPVAIAKTLEAETTLLASADDVVNVGRFLFDNQLLEATDKDSTERFNERLKLRRTSWTKWLLHHYLFFRIPIVRPNGFLDATASAVGWAFSRPFWWITLLALVTGLLLTGRQWDLFVSTFVDLFSWQGMVWFALAYAFVKTVHELGHAYAAKRFGCNIPTMGVAFLVLWPVLYTDTNETWRLSDRRQRVAVAAAGMLAEFMVAAWATLLWSLLPEGPGRTVAFLLATTTWISSVIINMSPFMRFDGYFVLMDWLDMPNLHSRSFALARWWLRETLFGLNEPPPERFGKRLSVFLICFAFATWIYRLLLFLGIAVLVYHFFFKALGVFLFVVEIAWFIARPIWLELGEWTKRRSAIAARPRTYVSLLVLGLFTALLVIPWRGTLVAQGTYLAEKYAVLYAPGPGVIKRLAIEERESVNDRQRLVSLASPETEHRLKQVEHRIAYLQTAVNTGSLESLRAQQRAILIEELRGAEAERRGLRESLARYDIRAPFNGVAVDLTPDLHEGRWVSKAEPLLAVRSRGRPRFEVYVDEDAVHRITIGARGRFFPDDIDVRPIPVTVEDVDRTALSELYLPYAASVYGGQVPVRQAENRLIPERAIFRVRLAPIEKVTSPVTELRGVAHIYTAPVSLLDGVWRAVAVVFLRESGV